MHAAESILHNIAHTLGGFRELIPFIVEDDLPDRVEIGLDTYCIDGKFPKNAMFGIEIKDKGLVMKTLPYAALPDEVRSVNDKLAPTFREFGYRGFFSSDDQLIANAHRLSAIPGVIVHGRYDVVTPVKTAFDLARAWPEASLRVVPDSGHAMTEPGIVHELVAATNRFA